MQQPILRVKAVSIMILLDKIKIHQSHIHISQPIVELQFKYTFVAVLKILYLFICKQIHRCKRRSIIMIKGIPKWGPNYKKGALT